MLRELLGLLSALVRRKVEVMRDDVKAGLLWMLGPFPPHPVLPPKQGSLGPF